MPAYLIVEHTITDGAVVNCVEIRFGDVSDHEVIASGGQVNALRDELLGERLPAVDLAHVDLT